MDRFIDDLVDRVVFEIAKRMKDNEELWEAAYLERLFSGSPAAEPEIKRIREAVKQHFGFQALLGLVDFDLEFRAVGEKIREKLKSGARRSPVDAV